MGSGEEWRALRVGSVSGLAEYLLQLHSKEASFPGPAMDGPLGCGELLGSGQEATRPYRELLVQGFVHRATSLHIINKVCRIYG